VLCVCCVCLPSRLLGLTIGTILDSSEETLSALLVGVGFYRRKAGYLLQTAAILRDRFGDDIPSDVPGLVSLPGVGMKMATICMEVGKIRRRLQDCA